MRLLLAGYTSKSNLIGIAKYYHMLLKRIRHAIFLILFLTSCSLGSVNTPAASVETNVSTLKPEFASEGEATSQPEVEPAPLPSGESFPNSGLIDHPDPTPPPIPVVPGGPLSYRYWRWWPVIPGVSQTTYQIYQRGLELGVNRHAFSIIGDCQSTPAVFAGRYDHPGRYQLPEGYEYLQATIDRFQGSFDRTSVTVQNGFSVTAALSPLWADPEICQSGETPLDCELRINRPIFVFITLGTNWNSGNATRHNEFLGQIIDRIIASGAVPILSTKGDNEEGDHSINLGIAEIAADRDLPLWNFWRAIQELPNHGLDVARDGNYLSIAAWDVRSFTGLQVLDTLWRLLDPEGEPDPALHAQ